MRVSEQIPIAHPPTDHNREYLRAKRDRLGHLLHHQGLALDAEMIHEERIQDRAKKDRSAEKGRAAGKGRSAEKARSAQKGRTPERPGG